MNSELLSPVLIFWLCRKENWSWAFSLGTQQENLGILSIMAFCGICWWCWSVTKLRLTLWGPMDCSMPGSSVLCCLLEFAQTHVCWISNAVQPSHPLLPPSSFTFNLSQHQGLFQGVGSSYQVAKILELQLQHQSSQWIFGVYFFFLGMTGLISWQAKGLLRVFFNIAIGKHQFLGTQPVSGLPWWRRQ